MKYQSLFNKVVCCAVVFMAKYSRCHCVLCVQAAFKDPPPLYERIFEKVGKPILYGIGMGLGAGLVSGFFFLLI